MGYRTIEIVTPREILNPQFMSQIIEGYDCVAAVREVRDHIDALYATDKAAFFEWLDNARNDYMKSLNIE